MPHTVEPCVRQCPTNTTCVEVMTAARHKRYSGRSPLWREGEFQRNAKTQEGSLYLSAELDPLGRGGGRREGVGPVAGQNLLGSGDGETLGKRGLG